ncbi:MAG: TolB family protein, partial [Acidobacteria bacterium]|nr:TolB family protein [Acidobacteriota bacterium]
LIALAGAVLVVAGGAGSRFFAQSSSLGLFEAQADVGENPRAGSVEYDRSRDEYRVRGGGANMWDRVDAFHFVWKRMSGDLTLTAGVRLLNQGSQQHRKAGWVIRQSLDPDSAYVSAVVHGDGLTSMQYRVSKGDTTQEVRSQLNMPRTVRLERRGDSFTLGAAIEDGELQKAGQVTVELRDPVYVGLAVCSHDVLELERAVFSRVSIENFAAALEDEEESDIESKLEIISPDGTDRKVIYRARRHFEAPNWSRDGKFLIFNSNGRIYTLPVEGGEPKMLNTGSADRCNNDHGLSPDGSLLALSHSPGNDSLIYVMPMSGGEPRLVVDRGPAYWHGWSPDGKTLAYVAERHGNFDIYTIPVNGGRETRLTEARGLDDGPDYTSDGKYIYFNSERTGSMKIWRMKPDGSAQEQVTDDGYADWFPHPSPDGKWLVFLSYDESVKGHPANKHVKLRIMPLAGGKPRILTALFGGQGSINVPSWSPDRKFLAFVSYRLLRE